MLITPISSYLRQRLIIYDNSDSLYVLNERARKEQIMKITIENGKETVINLSGQLDTLTSVDLEKEIAPILQGEAQTVVLDGAELTYISSAGLRLLLTLQKGMKNKGGSFRLKNIQNEIMEILNITGFSHILTIE